MIYKHGFATATYLREWNQLPRDPYQQENSAYLEGEETFINQSTVYS